LSTFSVPTRTVKVCGALANAGPGTAKIAAKRLKIRIILKTGNRFTISLLFE
jgi:hypothetical protein